jgi:hypothetical protein
LNEHRERRARSPGDRSPEFRQRGAATNQFGHQAKGDEIAARAVGRLESWLGTSELDEGIASTWAEASESVMRRRLADNSMKSLRPLLEQADTLLIELGAQGCAHRSRFMASAFEERLDVFASSLLQFVN